MNEKNGSNNLTSVVDNTSSSSAGYSIPGAIIPSQVADSGNVIQTSSSQADITSVKPSQVTNDVNVVQNGLIVSTVPSSTIVSQQGSEQSKEGEIKIETVLGEQNINQLNGTISASEPITYQNTVSNGTSNIGETPVSKKARKKKKNKNNDNNGSGATAVTGLLFFLVLAFGGGLGYFIYNDYFKAKEVIDPVKEWQKKRTVNVESLVVKELYSYVDLHGCDEQINFFYDDSRTVVNASDLSKDQKNYLAYNQLKHSSLDKKACSTYSVSLHKNDKDNVWYCGDEYASDNTTNNYNDEGALTYVISGDKVKNMVERIFGPASYKASTFKIGSSSRYLYDNKTDSYIFQSYYGGSSCVGYSNKLSGATQKGDILTINVVVTNKVSNSMMKYNYNFKETSNGNYYFVSLQKTAV